MLIKPRIGGPGSRTSGLCGGLKDVHNLSDNPLLGVRQPHSGKLIQSRSDSAAPSPILHVLGDQSSRFS